MIFKSSVPLSKATKAYSFLFCFLIFSFMAYVFHSAGIFFGQHVFPESLHGFSVINPDFEYWNAFATGIISCVSFLGLMGYTPFREYLYDAADELTRISWIDKTNLRISTGIVLVTIFLSSIVLFLMDTFLGKISTKIIASAAK
jgi:preprotein translocase SecE subunit